MMFSPFSIATDAAAFAAMMMPSAAYAAPPLLRHCFSPPPLSVSPPFFFEAFAGWLTPDALRRSPPPILLIAPDAFAFDATLLL